MGGNALKKTTTRRYMADEYHALVPDVVAKLTTLGRCDCVPAYGTKESFGDMDLVHSINNLCTSSVCGLFSPTEMVKNGPVLSFDYKQLQIDLIYAAPDTYDYAMGYYSWNDAGNLVGRIAHKLGLKHGHKGLTLPVRNGTYQIGEIRLTTDYAHALRFLDLTPMSGPETLEDIFNWVSSSKYFSPEIYLFENLNAVSRIRDKKRATYNKFLTWCESWNGPRGQYNANKSHYLPMVWEYFQGSQIKYQEILDKAAADKERASKFNGHIVSNITGLSGRELGVFMAKIKTRIDPLVDDMSPEELEHQILRLYSTSK